jgi:ferrous iron transport protein B
MTSLAVQPHIALLGNPNCGKTALFNLLTGSRQKVANYAGVTVERKAGVVTTPGGHTLQVIDLPGTYSLNATSADEALTRAVVLGERADEPVPELLVCVTDATHLRQNLRMVLEARRLGLPMLVALNMSDVARHHGIHVDRAVLERELGVPVVETVAIRAGGAAGLLEQLDSWLARRAGRVRLAPRRPAPVTVETVMGDHREVRRILELAVREPETDSRVDDALDRIALHPVFGMVLLVAVLFFVFQAVFSWAQMPMDAIKASVQAIGEFVTAVLPAGPLRSLLVDGIIAGAGGVLVFLPQILVLFLFILVLEDSGYLPRAAFMLDRVMASVGLTGRSFIPLLSSFACAVPGIMATRTIGDARDRWATIMIAPLMTCSARLPVYALLISAFIPQRSVAGVFNLQGLVLFTLYVAGIVSAMAVAWVLQRRGRHAGTLHHTLLLELPAYRWPHARNVLVGLWERTLIFVTRVGTIILSMTILLWFLASYPAPPAGATGTAIEYSLAGRLGHALQPLVEPIGFNWQIAIALIPGMAAREVAVSALGTVYALSATGEGLADQLSPLIAQGWSLATACSLLAWYVFAPQCISTLSITRRETGGWRDPLLMAGYLFALAYAAAFVTYRAVLALGGGG